MTKDERIVALRLAKDVIAMADGRSGGPDPVRPDDAELVLARLVELLIARGKRMGAVFDAALKYATAKAANEPSHHEWLALSLASIEAHRLEGIDP